MSLLAVLNTTGVSAQSYSSLWKAVEESESKDLPRGVVRDAMRIYTKASEEGNFPQMMKAWIVVSETKCSLDADSFSVDALPRVACATPVENAVYNAVLGSAYQAMCGASSVAFDEDTRQEYKSMAADCFRKALADRDALAKAKATDYLPVVTQSGNSRLYGNDMYSVIVMFIADYSSWDRDSLAVVLDDAAAYYSRSGNANASVLMRLAALRQKRQALTAKSYAVEVRQLLDSSENLEAGADVAVEYLDAMERNNASEDDRWQFVMYAKRQFRKSPVVNYFVNEENRMKLSKCSLFFRNGGDNRSASWFMYPDTPFPFELQYENLSSADLEVRGYVGEDDKLGLKTNGRLVEKRRLVLGRDSASLARQEAGMPYKGTLTDSLALPVGQYVVVLKTKGQTEASRLNVSSLRIISVDQPKGKKQVVVVDNKTGRPVPGAKVHLFDRKGNETVLVCDGDGACVFDASESMEISASVSESDSLDKEYISAYQQVKERTDNLRVSVYTDRSIYRPGQTVYVSGLVYADGEDNQPHVAGGVDIPVRLTDANRQQVCCDTLKSNEWGTFDTRFVLPKDRLPGTYTVASYYDGRWRALSTVRVEEYKRPTFDVTAEPLSDGRELSFGDSVTVKVSASTFAGVPVQGASVRYTVASGTSMYGYRVIYGWTETDRGETVLDDKGEAVLTIRTEADTTKYGTDDVVGYRLTAEVTDIAGETHTAEYVVRLSGLGFSLQVPYWQSVDVSDPTQELTVEAVNPNGQKVKANGTYTVSKDGKAVGDGTFVSGEAIILPSLPMGTYVLDFMAKDGKGNTVKAQRTYDVYDSEEAVDPRMKIKAAPADFDKDLFICRKSTFSEDSPAEILFAPCEGDVYVFCSIMSGEKVFEQKWISLGQHLYSLYVDYNKEYGDGVTLVMAYVRNGRAFTRSQDLVCDQPDRQLKLTWKTFRDNLTPGQKEEWILTVRDKDGNTVDAAEMMTTMYDASLDRLQPFQWSFSVPKSLSFSNSMSFYIPYPRILGQKAPMGVWITSDVKTLSWKDHDYDRLLPFEYDRLTRVLNERVLVRGGAALLSAGPRYAMAEAKGVSVLTSEDTQMAGRVAGQKEVPDSPSEDLADDKVAALTDKVRSDFNETAFFYPHLTADRNGEVHVAFTVPESVTRWRLQGLVHTKDVNYALIDTTCVTKKDFMVQPNMPRFVREGDKVSVVARVMNQGSTALSGRVRMEIMDAETGKVVSRQTKTVRVAEGQTVPVAFEYAATDKYPLLVCEVTAEAGDRSDGERNYLPVLDSRQYVTETVPFYIDSKESKTVDLSGLFNSNSKTATRKLMTLEYTANPSWTVIGALQGLRVPDNNDAISFAASLYANTTAGKLVRIIPGLREALSSQYVAADSSSVNSRLAEDERVKDIALRESPWLRDALKEADRRAELADLFNEGLISARTATAKEKLAALQNVDGSWSWFDGMRGSYHVTLAVCENLALLNSGDSGVRSMLAKAMDYLDKEEYRRFTQSERNGFVPGDANLQYLFVSALQPERRVDKDIRKMREDYLAQLEKSVRDLSVYGKANAAYVLRVFGHQKAADEFLQSVMEYSVSKPGMGRYYATDAAPYSWRDYRIPTQLAAMRAIRQSSVADRKKTLADMQVWLIRQKQTQMWDNPMNTIGAVSYLLEDSCAMAMGAVPEFFIDGSKLSVQVDTTKFLARQLGYVSLAVDDRMVQKGVNTLKVVPATDTDTEGDSHIAWGTVSTRFMEDMKSLQVRSSGELRITHRLMVDGKAFDPKTATLKVGDKVTVRLTVTADRDMDFVQVRSLSPACFEPADQRSGYRWMNGRGGYVARHDASVDVFFDSFTKGTSTFDLDYYVTRSGDYLTGVATVQCAYAPEYAGHTDSVTIKVDK